MLSFIGACLLWVGWFGFNAGSALAASSLATSAFVATHFATAAAALGMDVRGMDCTTASPACWARISGAVAGLVAITPASGFVKPFPALLIGVVAGIVCYLMVSVVKGKFGYDDALDAFGVHGMRRHAGRAADRRVRHQGGQRRVETRQAAGLVDGNAGQMLNQALGVRLPGRWRSWAPGHLKDLRRCDRRAGRREQEETEGLDLSMHGEEGYNLEA